MTIVIPMFLSRGQGTGARLAEGDGLTKCALQDTRCVLLACWNRELFIGFIEILYIDTNGRGVLFKMLTAREKS